MPTTAGKPEPRRREDTRKPIDFSILRVIVAAFDHGGFQYRQRTYNVDVSSLRSNALGQPIGPAVDGWAPPSRPPREPMIGRYCRIEPLDAAAHARNLHEANTRDVDGRNWTYLAYGPFESVETYTHWA